MMNPYKVNLSEFLANELQGADADLLRALLLEIAAICANIAAVTAKGALAEATQKLESQNVQGETQMRLDVLANDIFIEGLTRCGLVAGLASEEMDNVSAISQDKQAKYLLVFDPLDGSSNVPVNISVGSIFSILNAPVGRPVTESDFLQIGAKQVAAGYTLYGQATMLVLTVGKGTHAFTLDPDTQVFILTYQNLTLTETTSEFAINASNERFWEPPIVHYIEECKAGVEGPRGRDFNMRWVGSMVADIHRILMRGGLYLYPKDNKKPEKAGRLRLMYEANPMCMLIEQAGGRGSTGSQRILDIAPDHIHQRVPVIIGNAREVEVIEAYTREYQSTKT